MTTIKTQVPSSIVVSDFHKAIVTACMNSLRAEAKLADTLKALLKSKYGDALMNVKQYDDDDQKALAQASEAKGLKDNQYVRKAYAAAVKTVYGALPISMADESSRKRKERLASDGHLEVFETRMAKHVQEGKPEAWAAALAMESLKGSKKVAGSKPNETHQTKPNQSESLEQWIARVGVVNVLDALSRLLGEEASSRTDAKVLHALANKLAGKKAA